MNSPSLGLACNVYQEANALPGFLEMAAAAGFDDVAFYHTGPGGAHSTDGTIEMIEKWGARIEFGSIDEGFGAVRTKAVRLCKSEFVMILDADERFHAIAPILSCSPDLRVSRDGQTYDQMEFLRRLLRNGEVDAVRTFRRHWHDFSWKRPTQNWVVIPDWQLRVVRNVQHIRYLENVKMHEKLVDDGSGRDPRFAKDTLPFGPFHDHYHCFFKPMEPEQRQRDMATYRALDANEPVPA